MYEAKEEYNPEFELCHSLNLNRSVLHSSIFNKTSADSYTHKKSLDDSFSVHLSSNNHKIGVPISAPPPIGIF